MRHACGAERLGHGPGDVEGLGEIVGRDGERDVGESLLSDILHDHVDGDPRGGQRREELVVAPRLIGHPFERDPGLVLGQRHAAHGAGRGPVGSDDERAGDILEARADEHRDAELLGKLDRPRVHHAGAEARQFEHFVVADRREATGGGEDPRIGRVDAVDVGVDLADVSPQHRGERHGGGVGAATAERRDVAMLVDPLEAGGDHDPAVVEELHDVVGGDRLDAGLRVGAVGADADLGAGQAHRLLAEGLDRHREQRHAHLLAGGEEHVHLAGAGALGDLLGEIDKDVGLVPHGTDHDDDLVPRLVPGHRFARRRHDLLRVGHARPAELLDHQGHRLTAPLH